MEIERKFLVLNDSFKQGVTGVLYRQGYLSTDLDRTVRVRTAGDKGILTIKGATTGISRPEFEYEIPVDEANQMLDTLCLRPFIEKTRYKIQADDAVWEVDVFHGDNEGLVVAEIELNDEAQTFAKPGWLGIEVSDDPRYFNSALVKHPFGQWADNKRKELC